MLRVVTYKYPPFSTSHPFRTPTSYPVLSLIPPIPLSHFSWASHQPPLHDVITPYIGRSRPSDKGGPSHPNPEIRGGGGGRPQNFFWPFGSHCGKKKGGPGPCGPLSWIHHCHILSVQQLSCNASQLSDYISIFK